jgi:hypothetical protein
MKISLTNLIEAQRIADQRLHLTEERKKLRRGGTMTYASAKVVLQPLAAGTTRSVSVEISENRLGEVSQAILNCIEQNITQRIEALDGKLAALGIDIEEEA